MPILPPVKLSKKILISDVRLSQYGYWVVVVSLSPGRNVSVMIGAQGIPPDKACSLALALLGLASYAGNRTV